MTPILLMFLFYLAKEDYLKRRLEGAALFVFGAFCLFFGYLRYGFELLLYQTVLNLLFWAVCFLSLVFLEHLTARFLLGGADLLLWLALAPALKPLGFAALLPLACLLALPVQLVKLRQEKEVSAFPLVPYLAITVILILLNGG